jgi:hypothetical protein
MASYRTASSQIHTVSKDELAALAAYKERFQGEVDSDMADRRRKLAIAYAEERRGLFPKETEKEIRKAVELAAAAHPNIGRRYLSLAEAKKRNLDLRGLKSVQDRYYREVADLKTEPKAYSSGQVVARTVESLLNWLNTLPEGMLDSSVYVAPFAELWERRIVSYAEGAGRVTINDSHANAELGVLGGHLAVENRDADDFDHFDAARGNGFFIPYTVPNTGILQINAEMTCLLCTHHIKTWDEWFWSDFSCTSLTNFVVSVFWGHDDYGPASESLDQTLAGGLKAHGDGENYPGTVVQVAPGEVRSLTVYSDVAFPAGTTVWIYAGVGNQIYAALNDVSIEAWLDTRWQVNSLSIVTLQ